MERRFLAICALLFLSACDTAVDVDQVVQTSENEQTVIVDFPLGGPTWIEVDVAQSKAKAACSVVYGEGSVAVLLSTKKAETPENGVVSRRTYACQYMVTDIKTDQENLQRSVRV